ncbi:hypothetical protein F5B20DRAFT_579609 [Whalleya microplaca]|nr:hypothetical protein F5B20DRAFT_579609 [Whalleya microplaca]
MDVTSLLNSSSMVRREPNVVTDTRHSAENTSVTSTPSIIDEETSFSSVSLTPSPEKAPSRRTNESKPPSRSRTPWDANGYALPLAIDTKSTQVPVRSISHSESPAESLSPKSPRHKCSNSHSSLSSYASSSASLSHSRISSMSTVGGIQPMSAIPDVSSLEISLEGEDLAKSKVSPADYHQRTSKDGIMSPLRNTEELPLTGLIRSSSPSDAMLMSRPNLNSIRTSTQTTTTTIEKNIKPDISYLLPHLARHKRAISAPDFAAVNLDRSFPPIPPNTLQPPSPPYQGAHRSGYIMEDTSASPVEHGQLSNMERIVCMYKENCDTGSQPRKAISHIFGRNKSCTRNIPSHVWVHFCRKHYQRSRYRNAQEYARVQGDLVQKQIRRVQAWSDQNKEKGQGGIVVDWSLSMRKREQTRLQEKSNKKRPYHDESDDDDTLDRAVLNGTAVPDWLRDQCGDGYSTTEIEAIVARLQQEMEQNNMTQIPDIEILPNISMEASDDARSKAVIKRKTSNGSSPHKRSQSVGVTLQNGSQPMARRVSQPPYWRHDNSFRSSPVEKRQRISDAPLYSEQNGHMGLSRLPERPAPTVTPTLRPMYPLPHRPSFNHIQENRVEESYYNEESDRGSHYHYGAHLPEPSPQRHGCQPAAELGSDNSHNYLEARRHNHQRSYSELGGFQNGFSFRPPSDYPPVTLSYPSEPTSAYDRSTVPADQPQVSPGPPGYYDDCPAPVSRSFAAHQPSWTPRPQARSSPYPAYRHNRHQSTPVVPHSALPHASPDYNHTHDPRLKPDYEHSPSYHHHQHSYATSRQYATRPLVQETDQAKAIYSERR